MYNYGYYSPFSALFGILGWVIFALIIVWILKLGRRDHWMDKMGKHGFMKDSAMEILREKYAKGEISKEEFEAKKKDLSQ